jgi:hypothetical protein
LDGAAAAVAEWSVRRFGSEAATPAAMTGIAPALFIARYGAKSMRVARSADDINFYPGTWAFTGISYLLGFYAGRMTGALRATLIAGVGTLVATSWFSSPKPRSISTFAAELIWSSAAMVGGSRLAGLLDKLSARVAADNEKETQLHAGEQWAEGWTRQHRKAETIYQSARETVYSARPETTEQNSEVEYTRQELARLAEELALVATPPPRGGER